MEQKAETTKKIGLALGSGGARGIAHIGVLQVLEENGIPIHLVSGCSIGSIVGAIYATGTDLRMLEKYILSLSARDIMDPAIRAHGGLLQGNKLEEMVRVFTHNQSFGQTRIPFYCTAVDLESGQLVTFTEGKICRAVRASMSIPGMFAPTRIADRWYIDGGALEEIPVDVLHENGADVIIGVDLTERRGFPSGSKPGSYKTVLRAFDIMQMEITRLRNQKIDVRITPNAAFMGLLSTKGAVECLQEGRRVAELALPEIKRVIGESAEN